MPLLCSEHGPAPGWFWPGNRITAYTFNSLSVPLLIALKPTHINKAPRTFQCDERLGLAPKTFVWQTPSSTEVHLLQLTSGMRTAQRNCTKMEFQYNLNWESHKASELLFDQFTGSQTLLMWISPRLCRADLIYPALFRNGYLAAHNLKHTISLYIFIYYIHFNQLGRTIADSSHLSSYILHCSHVINVLINVDQDVDKKNGLVVVVVDVVVVVEVLMNLLDLLLLTSYP